MATATAQVITVSLPVRSFLLFAYLQALDVLSTFAFLTHGVHEANPLVRLVIAGSPHPVMGLLLVKTAALLLGLFCMWRGKVRVLVFANLFFGALVVWNLLALVVALTPGVG
jgi:Domain of unknown function (DUF5658)